MDFDQAVMWRRLSGDPGNYYCQAAEPERAQFRSFFEARLHEGQATVEFTKADGSQRVMICTLSEDHGARYHSNNTDVTVNQTAQNRRAHSEVRTVWDCEAKAWRSFRWDRLKRVEFSWDGEKLDG
jgi:hypothetical protein